MNRNIMNRNIDNDNFNPESMKVRAKIFMLLSLAHSQFDTPNHYKLSPDHLTSKVHTNHKIIKPGIAKVNDVIKARKHDRDADLAFARNELDSANDLYMKAISSDETTAVIIITH